MAQITACPFCETELSNSARVCRGCGANRIWGFSRSEAPYAFFGIWAGICGLFYSVAYPKLGIGPIMLTSFVIMLPVYFGLAALIGRRWVRSMFG